MKREFKESEEIKQFADKVICQEGLDLTPAEIKYLMVDPIISKHIYGRCISCSAELKFFSKVDYIIEISKEYWKTLDDKQKYLLVYHELKHIKVVFNENTGEFSMRLQKHDLEDFKDIIAEHGVNWIAPKTEAGKDQIISEV